MKKDMLYLMTNITIRKLLKIDDIKYKMLAQTQGFPKPVAKCDGRVLYEVVGMKKFIEDYHAKRAPEALITKILALKKQKLLPAEMADKLGVPLETVKSKLHVIRIRELEAPICPFKLMAKRGLPNEPRSNSK